jgi:AraC-like DNA-binding protein
LFVVFIGYFGIKQVGIFTHQEQLYAAPNNVFLQNNEASDLVDNNLEINGLQIEPEENTSTELATLETAKKKYSKSGLSETLAIKAHEELTALMSKEKLFTASELTLADLAIKLNIHPNYLSQVINEKEGKNFYDYINSLRIEEFRRLVLLPENKKYTILALAYDCGFNSKSSFNKYFKKATDLSPSE